MATGPASGATLRTLCGRGMCGPDSTGRMLACAATPASRVSRSSRGLLAPSGEAINLAVGLAIAIPSGIGVALSVLGNNTGSLVGVAISASLLPPAVNCGLNWGFALVSAAKSDSRVDGETAHGQAVAEAHGKLRGRAADSIFFFSPFFPSPSAPSARHLLRRPAQLCADTHEYPGHLHHGHCLSLHQIRCAGGWMPLPWPS